VICITALFYRRRVSKASESVQIKAEMQLELPSLCLQMFAHASELSYLAFSGPAYLLAWQRVFTAPSYENFSDQASWFAQVDHTYMLWIIHTCCGSYIPAHICISYCLHTQPSKVWCITSSSQPVWSVSRVWQPLLAAANRTAVFYVSNCIIVCVNSILPPYILVPRK
jgi:hypothetical protein